MGRGLAVEPIGASKLLSIKVNLWLIKGLGL